MRVRQRALDSVTENCPIVLSFSSYLVMGQCNHTFHLHCIHKWLESKGEEQGTCPLDRKPFGIALGRLASVHDKEGRTALLLSHAFSLPLAF